MSVFGSEDGAASLHYTAHLTQSDAPDAASSNPFGGGDGFDASDSAPPSESQQQNQSQPQSSTFSTSSMSSALEDVPQSSGSRAAHIASLPPPNFGPDEADPDDSKSKFGKITVGEPELRGGKFTGYHAYKITCGVSAAEPVFRRYSDFVWLRNVLSKAFPGVFVAPLPPKQTLGNKDESFVQGRRLDLQRWLQRIVVRPFLADHDATELFLHRSGSSFESEQKELLKAAENRPVGDIAAAYQSLFPEIARLPPAGDASEADMEVVKDYLLHAEARLKELVAALEKFVSIHGSEVGELGRVVTLLQASADTEKAFLERLPRAVAQTGVTARVDVLDAIQAWQLSAKWSAHSFEELFLCPARFELQDVEAMLEVVKARADLAARHSKSVAKVAKWSASPPKKEKEEVQRATDEAQARDEGLLLSLLTNLLLFSQFEQHWSFRIKQFKSRINRLAQTQMEAAKQMQDTWATIVQATS